MLRAFCTSAFKELDPIPQFKRLQNWGSFWRVSSHSLSSYQCGLAWRLGSNCECYGDSEIFTRN